MVDVDPSTGVGVVRVGVGHVGFFCVSGTASSAGYMDFRHDCLRVCWALVCMQPMHGGCGCWGENPLKVQGMQMGSQCGSPKQTKQIGRIECPDSRNTPSGEGT